MSQTLPEKISLIVLDSAVTSSLPEPNRAMFPAFLKLPTKSIEVSIGALSENINSIVARLGKIMDALPENCGSQYTIDELTFNLSINSSGKVSLIAEVGAGFSSGISIKLKRRA